MKRRNPLLFIAVKIAIAIFTAMNSNELHARPYWLPELRTSCFHDEPGTASETYRWPAAQRLAICLMFIAPAHLTWPDVALADLLAPCSSLFPVNCSDAPSDFINGGCLASMWPQVGWRASFVSVRELIRVLVYTDAK